MDQAVPALHQDDLFVRRQRGILKKDGFVWDDFILRQYLRSAVDNLNLQAVMRVSAAFAGQRVALGEENAHALQKLGHRLTIGGGGGSHPAVDDRDGLQTADGDAVDAVRISSSIGILLAQRNPGLVQNRVRIAAEGTANRYVFTVGDDVAVLCKNDEGKRAGKDRGHCGDQQHTAKNTALCAFLSSAHQSNLLSD